MLRATLTECLGRDDVANGNGTTSIKAEGRAVASTSKSRLERELEWEPGAAPVVLEHAELPAPPFIGGTRKLTIERNEKLTMHLFAEGSLADKNEFRVRRERSDAIRAGTFRDYDEIEFSAFGWQYRLRAFLDDLPDATFSSSGEIPFLQRGTVAQLTRIGTRKLVLGASGEHSFEPLGPAHWRSEWFINGPHEFVFTRHTKRRRQTSYSRTRDFGSVSPRELPGGKDAMDHCVVEA
ncbi:MAG TPA: hypothetical protein VH142_19345, partial [Polyangiaceae bacterium]|nr:hypothetical protein [Polyangiaceae bacterium]